MNIINTKKDREEDDERKTSIDEQTERRKDDRDTRSKQNEPLNLYKPKNHWNSL